MKIDLLPDFAKPYKTKGFDVRLVRGSYQLFKVTSKRVEGKKYPVLEQTYIGTIDPDKGLLPKKVSSLAPTLVEYGLSAFILKNFKRKIQRSMFNHSCSEQSFILGVILFMYGHIQDRFIRLSYLSKDFTKTPDVAGPAAINRIKKIALLITSCFDEAIPDKADQDYAKELLRELKVDINTPKPSVIYPKELSDVLSKYKLK
ncbi:hypothetical protein [Succinivibrio sp.]|uniref:hypothetical protein n=1 Tax=Succinivibrio sp. TaxID=2053619 RepID=UPI00386B5768